MGNGRAKDAKRRIWERGFMQKMEGIRTIYEGKRKWYKPAPVVERALEALSRNDGWHFR